MCLYFFATALGSTLGTDSVGLFALINMGLAGGILGTKFHIYASNMSSTL
jgi:hypothetical protein